MNTRSTSEFSSDATSIKEPTIDQSPIAGLTKEQYGQLLHLL